MQSRWLIVVAGAVGTAVGAGIFMVYAFGILGPAMSAEYHWDRSVVQYCLTSFLVAAGFGTLLLGNAISRWGIRKPAMISLAIFATVIAILGLLPASTLLFYAAFAMIGLASAAATGMPYAVSVTGWFDKKRGLALGLVNAGAGVGAALAPLFANFLITHYGWRAAFAWIAVAVGLAPILGFAFLVRELPNRQHRTGGTTGQVAIEHGYLRRREFWLIALAIFGVSLAMFGVMGSMVPLLTDRNVPRETVAMVLSLAGVSSWVGRVAVGVLMDKFFAPYVGASSFALALMGVGLVAFSEAPLPIMIGAVLIGFTFGAEGDLVTFLVSRYFSMAIYSRVLGAVWITWAWGGGLGTSLVGITYTATHSYEIALLVMAGVLVAATIAVLSLGPYSIPPARQPTTPGTTGTVAALDS
jgi:MFS family permease